MSATDPRQPDERRDSPIEAWLAEFRALIGRDTSRAERAVAELRDHLRLAAEAQRAGEPGLDAIEAERRAAERVGTPRLVAEGFKAQAPLRGAVDLMRAPVTTIAATILCTLLVVYGVIGLIMSDSPGAPSDLIYLALIVPMVTAIGAAVAARGGFPAAWPARSLLLLGGLATTSIGVLIVINVASVIYRGMYVMDGSMVVLHSIMLSAPLLMIGLGVVAGRLGARAAMPITIRRFVTTRIARTALTALLLAVTVLVTIGSILSNVGRDYGLFPDTRHTAAVVRVALPIILIALCATWIVSLGARRGPSAIFRGTLSILSTIAFAFTAIAAFNAWRIAVQTGDFEYYLFVGAAVIAAIAVAAALVPASDAPVGDPSVAAA